MDNKKNGHYKASVFLLVYAINQAFAAIAFSILFSVSSLPMNSQMSKMLGPWLMPKMAMRKVFINCPIDIWLSIIH